MADLKPKDVVNTKIDTSSQAYIEKLSIALMNLEENKRDKKAIKSNIIVSRK